MGFQDLQQFLHQVQVGPSVYNNLFLDWKISRLGACLKLIVQINCNRFSYINEHFGKEITGIKSKTISNLQS